MNIFQKLKVEFAAWRLFKKIGGSTMNAGEIIAAIQAAEAMLPEIEKGFSDVKQAIASVESLVANVKAKIAGAKAAVPKA